MHIQLLGGFAIRMATGESIVLHQPRLQLLAVYLLLHANTDVLRSHVAYLFWPDSRESQARTNLRKLLHNLRNLDPQLDAVLEMTTETIRWRLDTGDVVDVRAFAQALDAAAQAHGAAARRDLEEAVGNYGGDLLPGHYDDWVLVARERLHLRYVNALAELAELQQAAGDLQAALQIAQRLVQADRVQETSYRLLMGLHLEMGEPAAALRVYHTCATLLREELGVEPGAETHTLYLRILRAGEQGEEPGEHAARGGRPGAREASLALVGRRAEWQRLRHIWQDAQRGKPQLAVIQGEAGIGKTRLAEELVETARKQGCAVLAARAYAAEGRTAYGPIADLLRDERAPAALRGLDAVWQAELARIMPELAVAGRGPDAPISEAWQQRRFHEALVHGCLAVGQPLVIHLDDLQWFDADSLSWVHFLLRFDARAQLLVVATVRPEEIQTDHPYHTLRQTLRQGDVWHEFSIDALTPDNVADMAATLVGAPLPAAANAALFRATEGNPFFVLETLRALRAGPNDDATEIADAAEIADALVRGDLQPQLTPRIQAVIQARLAHLSPAARAVMRVAAVIGRHFTFELLQAVGQAGDPEKLWDTPLGLVNALDELWQRRIIREHGPNAYDFGHDRIREAVYTEISPVLRPHLHARVATTLETVQSGNLGAVAGQIAAHYEAAGSLVKAAHSYGQAARYAYERFAHADAFRHVHRALELTSANDLRARFELCRQLELLYALQVGSSAERFANLQVLVRIAAALHTESAGAAPNSPETQQALARRASVAVDLATYYSVAGQVDAAIVTAKEAIEFAQRAEALPELAHALNCLGWSGYWVAGKMSAARRELVRAAELAQTLGMDELEAVCLEQLAAAGMFSGMTAHDMVNNLLRALTIHEKNNNLYLQASVMNKLSYIVLAQGEGEYAQAQENYFRALEISRQIGWERMECLIADNLGMISLARGDYSQAEYWLEECRRRAQRDNFSFYQAVNLSYLAYLYANLGRLDEAVGLGRSSLQLFTESRSEHRATESYSILGYTEYLRQDYARALEHLRHALNLARGNGDRRFEATALVRLGHVYLALDQLADAQQVYARGYDLRQSLQQYRRSLEALVGLARVAWREARRADAREFVNTVYDQLMKSPLDFTEEAFQVYFYCYQMLDELDDPRVQSVYDQACRHLDVCRSTLDDAADRARFDSLPLHQQFQREHV